MISTDILINYLQKFLNFEIENYWNETKNYKKFQNKLLDINEFRSSEKEYLYNKFLKFNNLTESQFKELVHNSFIYNINEILQAVISKKQYAIYKLQGNSQKIDFKIPSAKKFFFYIILQNAKFFYENIYIIKDKHFVIKKNIQDNIKTTIYSYIPITELLELQLSIKKNTKENNSNSTSNSSNSSSSNSSNSSNSSSNSSSSNNISGNNSINNSISSNKSEITEKKNTDVKLPTELQLNFIKPQEKITFSDSTKLFVKNISVKGK
jgi:hypothetical protein